MQGRVGVLLEVSATNPATLQNPEVTAAVQDITLHICASSPICISRDDVPADVVAKEREIATEQVKDKPADAIAKIVEGKMGKYFSQVCLLEQGFIKDPDHTVADLLKSVGAKCQRHPHRESLQAVRHRRGLSHGPRAQPAAAAPIARRPASLHSP